MAVVALVTPDALVGVFYDDGIYAALARSMAEGGGYRVPYLPGQPVAVHYPPGYPAFLALLWTAWPSFPDNVPLLKGANAVCMGLFTSLAAAYLAPRATVRPWVAVLALFVAATSIPMLAVATVLFSEPLFLVLAAGALWSADSARVAQGRRVLLLAVSAGLLAGAATLTRSIGVALIIGAAGSLVMARRYAAAVFASLAAFALVLPWTIWSSRHSGAVETVLASNYGTYGQFMAQAGSSWLSPMSLVELVRPLTGITVPSGHPVALVLGGACLVVLVLVGLRQLWASAPALVIFLAAYVAIVATWPYGPDRFVWAILPWLAVAMVEGSRAATRAAPTRAAPTRAAPTRAAPTARLVTIGASLLLAIGFARFQIGGLLRGGATTAQRDISATFRAVLPWITEQTDSSAVIAGEDEALIWLYSGRRAVPSYLWRVRGRGAESFGADTLRAFLDRNGATHLLLTGPGTDAAPTVDALLGRHPGYLRMVHAWPGPMFAFAIQRGG